MAITTTMSSSSLFHFSHVHKPKTLLYNSISCTYSISSYSPFISPLTLSLPLSKQSLITKNLQHWRVSASTEDISTEELVSSATKDDGVSTVVSTLLFIAFVGLSILTIGVIYIAVTDFLQKREKDKFEKEEAAKKEKKKKTTKKKSGKKISIGGRPPPRGFGQKIVDEDDEDEDFDD